MKYINTWHKKNTKSMLIDCVQNSTLSVKKIQYHQSETDCQKYLDKV